MAIRAAFDVGSGATKLTVGKIEKGKLSVLFSEQTEILVGSHLKASLDYQISRHICDQLQNQLLQYKEIAIKQFKATEFACICTAAFRLAKNGSETLSELEAKLGFPFQLISQELEGELGFQTAVAVSGLDCDSIISWDSGGSSFQIVAKGSDGLNVLEGPVGSSSCAEILAKIRGVPYQAKTLNPVSMEEYTALKDHLINDVLESTPDWLQEKLASGCEVIGFGGETCLFRYPWYMNQSMQFTLEDIPSLVQRSVGRRDDELNVPQPQFLVQKFALMSAVMEKYGFQHVKYFESNGNTEGMLLYTQLWQKEYRQTTNNVCSIL